MFNPILTSIFVILLKRRAQTFQLKLSYMDEWAIKNKNNNNKFKIQVLMITMI